MVKAEEPFQLLLAGLQVYDSGGEGGSVKLLELLKHDLCLLAIGSVPGKEMKALPGGGGSVLSFRTLNEQKKFLRSLQLSYLCILHLIWRSINIKRA